MKAPGPGPILCHVTCVRSLRLILIHLCSIYGLILCNKCDFLFTYLTIVSERLRYQNLLLQLAKQKSKDEHQNLLQAFHTRIHANGLTIIENSGNGNCMFEAISHQTTRLGRPRSPQQLRQVAIQHLQENPQTVRLHGLVALQHCMC